MKPRHLARLTAGAAAITITFAVASTSAAGSSTSTTTGIPAPSTMHHMATVHDTSIDHMSTSGMTAVHSDDMGAEHVAMREQMHGAVPNEALAGCDEMHAATTTANTAGTAHLTHHGSAGS